METKKETCADLVKSKMFERNLDLEALYDIINDSESEEEIEEARESIDYLALEITEQKSYKILLSTGGPSDWIEVQVHDDNSVKQMAYHYADWFDHAETEIYSNSWLWEYAIQIIEAQQ